MPVIFEITQRIAMTTRRTKIIRSTTRVDGPYASTAAFAAVAALFLVVSLLT
jgi:hypothetical protein